MEKDVLISIRGLQYLMDEESGEQEPVEVMTTGSYYKKNGHHFLIYDEATEGFDMMTHNMIKFTENALEVRKRGLIDVHMIFEEDKKNISFYHTPYGMINMGVAATKVRMKETPDQILLKAEYALDINDSYVGGLRNRYRGKTAGRRKTEFIKKYPGRMKIIQLGYFREQRAKVRACTRPWRLPRKQKETRKACFFLFQMKFYFSSPRALRSIFCQKPFFFAGCSNEPRMPRTPVM